MKKVLVLTGGGDCPGLNAVIRAIVKFFNNQEGWQVLGSIEAFNGVLRDPQEVIVLDNTNAAGIHVKGGTIIKTTNKGNPFNFPFKNEDGTLTEVDRSDELIEKLDELGVEAVISIGGDGSQGISQKLYEKGVNIIGVPKTIDNDLSSTDFTFGFQTAVQIATDSFDKLVSTAESHDRVLIMEVMGRDAGWIALHTAIAGGSEVCLIPEIPYDVNKVAERIKARYHNGRGFAHIVVAEGAKPVGGDVVASEMAEV
ncbi:MAG: ATP-dependent 6-phosphofructokinase, partial [Bacteroidota bacterium]